ncbi:MAG: PilW family protein [Gammaproteobacteria bacterium]|nr:PilW family protein [Gammaproteobacteria bacterium]
MRRAHQAGLSLIELLVALVISAVLIFGATQVYVDSRNSYTINENVARLQETARYAMSVIESDLRMANYWGLIKGAATIDGKAGQAEAPAAVAPGVAINSCGTNYAVDLQRSVEGDNDTYQLGADRAAGCDALSGWNTDPVLTADTLTIRRASTVVDDPDDGFEVDRLHLCSTRQSGFLFSDDGSARPCNDPAQPDAPLGEHASSVNDLIMHAYYVDQNADSGAGVPSLRRKALCRAAGCGLNLIDEEVIAGVEDLQVQFGVETGIVGAPTGNVTRYVNPDDALFAGTGWQIVAVRVWLLVRSEAPEVGFVDGRTYEYGDRLTATGTTADLANAAEAGKAFAPADSDDDSATSIKRFRRMLVSRTFQLRNTVGT